MNWCFCIVNTHTSHEVINIKNSLQNINSNHKNAKCTNRDNMRWTVVILIWGTWFWILWTSKRMNKKSKGLGGTRDGVMMNSLTPHLCACDHITSGGRADEVGRRRMGRGKKRHKMNQNRQVYHSFAFGRSGKLRFHSGSKRGQTGEHRYYGNQHPSHPHDQSSSYPLESKIASHTAGWLTDTFTG